MENAKFAVVAFRVRPDNQRRNRVFRYVRTFLRSAEGAECFARVNAGYKVLLAGTEVVAASGDETLVERWSLTRSRQVGGADPFLAADYGNRALSRERRSRLYTETVPRHELLRWIADALRDLRRHQQEEGGE